MLLIEPDFFKLESELLNIMSSPVPETVAVMQGIFSFEGAALADRFPSYDVTRIFDAESDR